MNCSNCFSVNTKKNGKTRHGKQRYQCKDCNYQFSAIKDRKEFSVLDLERIDKLLLERLSLRGICRVMNISLSWLLRYIEELYCNLPKDLNVITTDVDIDDYRDEKLDSMIYDFLEKKEKLLSNRASR